MPITVYSPHSGNPVKVRDQDAGRAVKDEEGRIFYVLPKSDGNGYYGASTRTGHPKEEARAKELEGKVGELRQDVHEQVEEAKAPPRDRHGLSGKVLVISAAVVVLFLGWLFTLGPFNPHKLWTHTPPPPPQEIVVGGGSVPPLNVGDEPSPAQVVPGQPTRDPGEPGVFLLPKGLKYKVVRQGTGAACKFGDHVQVRYTGYLSDGAVFEASAANKPFELTVGAERNLPFWNEALPGMVEGEERTLTVPPELGYGTQGNAMVPPNETLRYRVELLRIVTPETNPDATPDSP